MDTTSKLTWLKRVLLFKVVVCLLVWGLPALTGPAVFLGMFGVRMPEDPFFLRMFGAVVTALALLYWFAYRDPLRNRDIITYAVVDNGLSTLAILFVALTSGLASWFFWVSGALTAFFTAAFWLLRPGE
jgi:hypothetical protein